ncbi:protein of unknown function [Candidatus Nitrosotalea okcheonensis]|uniref:Uncharacterized protein n=1 Tax=Candidatus Nitrosotalea okcheonensis TaxID=1903276 RepID=A0A2H1FIP3_9ARCH|nr:protein of unknown function [Candidatus Nitrosotalea okcheonensis]
MVHLFSEIIFELFRKLNRALFHGILHYTMVYYGIKIDRHKLRTKVSILVCLPYNENRDMTKDEIYEFVYKMFPVNKLARCFFKT